MWKRRRELLRVRKMRSFLRPFSRLCCTTLLGFLLPTEVVVVVVVVMGGGSGGAASLKTSYPVPRALPPNGWNSVGERVFLHGCRVDGLFDPAGLAEAARYPLMTVEKGQGLDLPGFADDKMAAIAQQWKAAQRRRQRGGEVGWALFYTNAHLDWPFFAIHQRMEANPAWPVQRHGAERGGDPCRQHGDPTFPQPPEGMLLFNHSRPDVRAAFVDACVNAIENGFDGCFIDSVAPATARTLAGYARRCNTSVAAVKAVTDGTVRVLAELQRAVGNRKLVVAKDSFAGGSEEQVNGVFPSDAFCSCYSCDWTSTHNPPFRRQTNTTITYAEVCQIQILEAIRLGRRGQVVLLHGEVNRRRANDDPAAAAADFAFALAAFLVAASDTAFFGYSNGWYFNGTRWHDEYDRALGPPLGPAVQGAGDANMTWSRRFRSGTTVRLDVLHKRATIEWADGGDPRGGLIRGAADDGATGFGGSG